VPGPPARRRASAVLDTQEAASARVKELNPNDHPDVERVRNIQFGGRNQWRRANIASSNIAASVTIDALGYRARCRVRLCRNLGA
jgi:hypothetical protein